MHKFKTILLFTIIVIMAINLYSQEAKKSSFGIQYTLSYDFYVYNKNRKPDYIIDVLHHAPAFSYRIKNHNLYIGPLLSHVFQPKPIGSEKYDNKAFGLHFGYRYYSNELLRNFRIFGQFHFSIFWVEYRHHQLGLPGGVTGTEIRVNNTASFGVDYEAIPNLHIYAGTGFGSYDGFFLILERVNLSEYIGVKYEF
ncbi:MAG: hypothetical protein II394_05160 [Bacteroidales bacterium]|nr:hypothetical protein [Bacteroidales bacterium]